MSDHTLIEQQLLTMLKSTFKTYLRRCRHAMAEKAPTESRETIQESVPKTLNNTHSDPIVNEEESGISRQNNRSLKAILDARDRGSDPDIDRYLAAKKPLNRRKS